jgi:hypothetical protein
LHELKTLEPDFSEQYQRQLFHLEHLGEVQPDFLTS